MGGGGVWVWAGKSFQKGCWKQWGSKEINLNSLTRCTGTKPTTVQMFSCIQNFTDTTSSIAGNTWRELWSMCQQKWDCIPRAWSYPDASQPCGKQLPFTCMAAWIPCAPRSNTDPGMWKIPLGTAPFVFLTMPLVWLLRSSLLSESFNRICWGRWFFSRFNKINACIFSLCYWNQSCEGLCCYILGFF